MNVKMMKKSFSANYGMEQFKDVGMIKGAFLLRKIIQDGSKLRPAMTTTIDTKVMNVKDRVL